MINVNEKYCKSKRQIRSALLDLLCYKSYPDITVIEIAERANVARTTFYSHYNDKNEVLDEISEDLINDFIDRLKDVHLIGLDHFQESIENDVYPNIEFYFKHFQDNYSAYKVMFNDKSGTNYIERFTEGFYRFVVSSRFFKDSQISELLIDSFYKMVINHYVNIFKIYIESELRFPQEILTRILLDSMKTFAKIEYQP